MIELLSPAGSPEAVIAAVQNGADAVYMGMGNFNARRGAKNFTDEEFERAVRYCHVRGCKVYVTLNTLINDREVEPALQAARLASEVGTDGIIIQDLGLISAVRQYLPDIPLHASTQMSIHNLAGVEAAAELGITRAVLARELSLDQIRYITQEIFVHGALCFCHSGQCYMSALIGQRSGNRGMCAQPCRLQYSLGGRMDDHPLSLKDNCLIDRLQEIEDAGVACIKIEGRMKRPEYTAIVTKIYAAALKEHRQPSADELNDLERAFSRQGFTQGYFDGNRQDMFGTRSEPARDTEQLFTQARKAYSEGELRRVPVHFYTVAEKNQPIRAIAFDDDGHKAVASGRVPEKARGQGLSSGYLTEQMFKTGGTPYSVVENKAQADPGLFLPAAAINELRRNLVADLSEQRGQPPAKPRSTPPGEDPAMIFQVLSAEQLTPELAALKPRYLYVPMTVMSEYFDLLEPFEEHGTTPVVVLPRVITDDEEVIVRQTLEKLFDFGINEALVGNLGHAMLARSVGMRVRGDFGLNVFNSLSMEMVRQAGFLSATASQMADRMGAVFPVVKEFGCRNVIYNAHKLYLADKAEDLYGAGLWGMRMMFTTETPRECLEVAKVYLGQSDYQPNVLTRGLYYRGVE